VRRWIGFAPRDDGQYYDDLYDPMRRYIIIHPINPPEVLKVIGGAIHAVLVCFRTEQS
jgi:hypothetical protein